MTEEEKKKKKKEKKDWSGRNLVVGWMQESESDYHQKHRVQFKDQGFLAGNSCIIEINSCEKCHRKKTS